MERDAGASDDDAHHIAPCAFRRRPPARGAHTAVGARIASGDLLTGADRRRTGHGVRRLDRQLIADETYFVAEHDSEMVACGGWSRRKTLFGGDRGRSPLGDPLLDPNADAARIRAFFVHPAYARRGIGRLMVSACERAAAGD